MARYRISKALETAGIAEVLGAGLASCSAFSLPAVWTLLMPKEECRGRLHGDFQFSAKRLRRVEDHRDKASRPIS
jgi:hypothetical protein